MTTAHRPTLESKRGKIIGITDTISHARLLPAHTQLKYRQKGQGGKADAERAIDELKLELLQNEKEHYLKTKGVDFNYADRFLNQAKIEYENRRGNRIAHAEESYNQKRLRVLEETKDLDQSSDEDNSNSENDSESDLSSEDSDDETEQLMRELAKIKREKEEEKQRQELEVKTKIAANSNPLLTQSNSFQVKRGWRSETVFRNQHAPKRDENDTFVNDMLRSDFHQRFLSKYVR